MNGGGAARRSRTLLLAVAGAAVSVAAVWIVVHDLDLARTAAIVVGANPLFLALALAVVGAQAVVRSLRWQLLLPRRADGSRIPIGRVLPPMLIGYLGNAVMPARLGEVARAALVARRESVSPAESLGSVALERVVDVLVLGALGVGAAIAMAAPGWMVTAAVTGTVVAGIGVGLAAMAGLAAYRGRLDLQSRWLARLAPVRRVVSQVATGARVVDRPLAVAAAAGLTLVAWALDASLFWLVARSLGLDLAPAGAILVSAVAVLSTAVPTAPGYVGTFELAAVAAAGVAGIAGESALAFAVLAHLLGLVPLALAGAASLWALGGGSLRGLAAGPVAPATPRTT